MDAIERQSHDLVRVAFEDVDLRLPESGPAVAGNQFNGLFAVLDADMDVVARPALEVPGPAGEVVSTDLEQHTTMMPARAGCDPEVGSGCGCVLAESQVSVLDGAQVAGCSGDAEAEQVAEAPQVSSGGVDLVQDAVLTQDLGAQRAVLPGEGVTTGNEPGCGASVDQHVRVEAGRPGGVAVVEPGGEPCPHGRAERDVPALPRYAVPGGTPSSPYVADEGMLFRVIELALWSDDPGAALDAAEIVLRDGQGQAYPPAGLAIAANGFVLGLSDFAAHFVMEANPPRLLVDYTAHTGASGASVQQDGSLEAFTPSPDGWPMLTLVWQIPERTAGLTLTVPGAPVYRLADAVPLSDS